ncbi:hypothetical protein [Thalassoroseus pseudoceratinae]|uniref:hypothetical protein n=1 Tax=Thalassoroseus pseudoceratinae TaxID=2713176 RepID=UPI00141DFD2C|nr:hypothetical protein [Thalassoroseus pseudoceratinae]
MKKNGPVALRFMISLGIGLSLVGSVFGMATFTPYAFGTFAATVLFAGVYSELIRQTDSLSAIEYYLEPEEDVEPVSVPEQSRAARRRYAG